MSTLEKEIPIARYTVFNTPPAGQNSFTIHQHFRIALQQISIQKSVDSIAQLAEQKKELEGLLQWNIDRKAQLEIGLAVIVANLKIATEAHCKPSEKDHQERSVKEIRGYELDYKLEIRKRERRIQEFSGEITEITSKISGVETRLEKRKEVLLALERALQKSDENTRDPGSRSLGVSR